VKVAIAGAGAVGRSIARELVRSNHHVMLLERKLEHVEPEVIPQAEWIHADACELSLLEAAQLETYDVVIAATGDDKANIVLSLLAKTEFGVGRVVARIYDAKRAAVYERLGIPTVATVPWTTDRLLNVLTRESETTKWRDPSGNVGVAELPLHEDWAGHAVTELEAATGGRVAFMLRLGTGLLPDTKTVIQAGDHVFIAAISGHIAEALAISALPPSEDNDR